MYQVFLRRQIFWLWLDVLWHALVNAVAVYTVAIWGTYESEAMLAGFVLVGLAVIFLLRPSDSPDLIYHEGVVGSFSGDLGEDTVEMAPNRSSMLPLPEIEETPEKLDGTRYT